MKFAAHDRGSARTLIRTAPRPRPADPGSPRRLTVDRRGEARSARPTDAPPARDGHGDGHQPLVELEARGVGFTVRRGQRIFGPDEAAGLVYVVRRGCVRLTKALADGRSIDLALLGPHAIFAQEDRTDGLASGIAAEAFVDATVTVVEGDDLAAMVGQSPALAAALVAGMTRRLTGAQMLVERILARDVTVRLAALLLTLSDLFGRPLPDGTREIALAVPHRLLADMIGANRVTVTRRLGALRSAGLTRPLDRNRIAVDAEKLRAHVRAAARPAPARAMPHRPDRD
jgi:CRP/FNR family transcriptional regulator